MLTFSAFHEIDEIHNGLAKTRLERTTIAGHLDIHEQIQIAGHLEEHRQVSGDVWGVTGVTGGDARDHHNKHLLYCYHNENCSESFHNESFHNDNCSESFHNESFHDESFHNKSFHNERFS